MDWGCAMQYNEDMIRDYLLRKIARKNKRISGCLKQVVKSNRGSYNVGFNEILGFFAGGLDGTTMTQIFDHMDRNQTKKYAPYNYFDIDTLNSYDTYLQTILTETDLVAHSNGHKWSTAQDFHKGFAVAKSVWREGMRKSTHANGYYNYSKPVSVVKGRQGGYTVLSPKKPMTEEQFEKKYNEGECAKQLYAYLQKKHYGIDVLVEAEVEKEPIEREKYSYIHRGRLIKLDVLKKEYYTDIEGRGLTSITAEGREGRLYTTNYNDGRVYDGDLYDLDGRLVQVDGGGQVFYENKNFYDSFRAKHQEKPEEYKEDEDGQMYLF
jgi:hypothetical protein